MASSKRSPNKKQSPNTPSKVFGSDPALNITNKLDNQAKRHKRSFESIPGSSDSSFSEIKGMFTDLKEQQNQKFSSLCSDVSVIMSQNQDIQKTVEFMAKQYDEILVKVNNLEQANSSFKKLVKQLESRIDFLEQNARNTSIEIRNVPKVIPENKQTLLSTVKEIGTVLKLETPLQDLEFKDIHRTKSDAIVVDFTTTTRKESFIATYRNYNKQNREKNKKQLSTDHVKIKGQSRVIYISEFLSPKAKRLYYLARELVKIKKLNAAWTLYGKVYIKKDEGSTPQRILEESDIHKIAK